MIFKFLNMPNAKKIYHKVMKRVMTKKDEILKEFKERLKIRYYRR